MEGAPGRETRFSGSGDMGVTWRVQDSDVEGKSGQMQGQGGDRRECG